MSGPALPTTDLYFTNGCGDRIARWWRRGPVRRLGANCFRCGDTLLLIRRDEPALVEQALRWPGRLLYLIDDDIDGAAQSAGLPPGYRERLGHFARGDFDRLVRRADIMLVSSDALADRLRADGRMRGEIVRIDPFWAQPFADPSHFANVREQGLQIAHLGTASHGGGLAKATPAILAMLEQSPSARFTFFGARDAHPDLERHPRARRLRPMAWPRYRRWIARQRFHLGLYPLDATAFDRARSANKLIEHAIVGAVGVYPAGFAPAALVGDGAIIAPDDPAEWTASLIAAAAQAEGLAARATQAADALRALDIGGAQRRLWSDLLGFDRH